MKTSTILISAIALLLTLNMKAQNKSRKVKVYRVLIITDESRMKGFLYEADSTGLNVSQDIKGENLEFINAVNIRTIKIRKRGQVLHGAVIGALSGITFGYLIGLSGGDDEPGWFSYSKEEKGTIGAVAGGIVGTTIGTLISTARKKFNINYDINQYKENLMLLQVYSILEE